MYCTICECEFEGWTGKCPQCNNRLLEVKPSVDGALVETVDYEELRKRIVDGGGKIEINLSAAEVTKARTRRFPWMGFGFAWTHKMKGAKNGLLVELHTTKVEKKRNWKFPYQGLGYAWRQEMQGSIGGHAATLTAKNVIRKRAWRFPYSGFGYAWTDEMSGECGRDINIELKTTHVVKIRRWQFPYFGFGYSWVKKGLLSLTLAE